MSELCLSEKKPNLNNKCKVVFAKNSIGYLKRVDWDILPYDFNVHDDECLSWIHRFWCKRYFERKTKLKDGHNHSLSFQNQDIFDFQKGQGRSSLSSLVVHLWVWLNMHQYPWICLNIFENTWIDCFEHARALDHFPCLTGFWRCLRF